MNLVTYEGHVIEVPDWVQWVAADFSGDVYMFEHEPRLVEFHPKEFEYVPGERSVGSKTMVKHDLVLPWLPEYAAGPYPLVTVDIETDQDNPAVTALVAALIDGTIKASTLFKKRIDLNAPSRAEQALSNPVKVPIGVSRVENEDDDRPLTELQAKEKLRIILTEVVRDTFRSEVVARILGGRKTLAEAVHEKDEPLLEGFARFVSTTFNVSVQWKDISGYNFVGLMRDIWKRSTKKVKPAKSASVKAVPDTQITKEKKRAAKEPSPVIGLDGSDDDGWAVADAEHEEDVAAETRKARALKSDSVKVAPKEKPFDNSPNWGLSGRMNQRRIDAQSAATNPVQAEDLDACPACKKTDVCNCVTDLD